MCRFACYIGSEITLSDFVIAPCHSIMFQSFSCKERTTCLNGDGFGIAWYAPSIRRAPGVFRAITPAWSNRNLINLCGVTKSHCIIAHVRAATQGLSVSESNCHPFSHDKLSFVHNGEIACWKSLKKQVVHMLSQESFSIIEGSTDSEYIFALLLDAYKKYSTDPDALLKATVDTVHLIQELVKPFDNQKGETTLNLGITDGDQVICTRFSTGTKHLSLYYSPSLVFQKELNQWQQDKTMDFTSGTVIASEPLNGNRSEWTEVPKNHLVHITKTRECKVIAL